MRNRPHLPLYVMNFSNLQSKYSILLSQKKMVTQKISLFDTSKLRLTGMGLLIDKYTVTMVSEMILVFNWQLRLFDNKSPCCPPVKGDATKRVYSNFKLNFFRLIRYDNKLKSLRKWLCVKIGDEIVGALNFIFWIMPLSYGW